MLVAQHPGEMGLTPVGPIASAGYLGCQLHTTKEDMMPAKGSSQNPRYLGLDERGYPMWLGDCGHPVGGRSAKLCQRCHNKQRSAPDFLGVVDGRNTYRAQCGHIARKTGVKRCRKCRSASALKNHPYSKGYYPVVYVKGGKGKQVRVHTLKAEAALGRPMRKGEVVHHINMDKFDNRNSNLLICDRSYHRYLHHAMQLAFAGRLSRPPPPN